MGNRSLASSLADEWMYWKVGIADDVVMKRNKSYIFTLLIIGYLVILILSIFKFKKKTINND